jgi:hypothetical protein
MIAPINDDPQPTQNPLPTDNNGRDAKGRFGLGNKAAKGNPHQRRVQSYRAAVYEFVEPEKVRDVMLALYTCAMEGEVDAIKEFLNRTVGKYENQADGDGDDDGPTMAVPRDVLIEMLRSAGQRSKPGAG